MEFDLISLQQNKKKKQKKVLIRLALLFIIISGLVIGIFYRRQFFSTIKSFIPKQEEKQEISIENLEQIEGLYEREFFEGEKVAIVGSNLTKEFTIVSVNNAIIHIGNKAIQLERNVPYQIDVDNDGSIDYLFIMRKQDIENNTLLIRIDPRIK